MGSSPIYRTIKKLFASAKSFLHEAPCGHEGMKRPSAMKCPSGMIWRAALCFMLSKAQHFILRKAQFFISRPARCFICTKRPAGMECLAGEAENLFKLT